MKHVHLVERNYDFFSSFLFEEIDIIVSNLNLERRFPVQHELDLCICALLACAHFTNIHFIARVSML